METQKTETEIQKEILTYLKQMGFFVWRQNSGGRGKVRFGIRGIPDIIGMTSTGQFLGVEVKRPGKDLSDEQIDFMIKARACGGWVCRAESLDSVKRFLRSKKWERFTDG